MPIKLNKTYNTGTYSPFFTLDDLDEDDTQSLVVQKQQIAGLNLNLTDPLSYVWYGSSAELIRVSLEHIKKYLQWNLNPFLKSATQNHVLMMTMNALY